MAHSLRYLALAAVFLISCSVSPSGSDLHTTSDKLKEYGYVVEGSFELPLDQKPYEVAHMVDVYLDVAEATDRNSPAIKEKLAILSSEASLKEDFAEKYAKALPLVQDGQVDGTRVKYWIARHLKYNMKQLLELKLSTTLRDVREWSHEIDEARNVIKISYKAFLLGVRQFAQGDDLKTSPLQVGAKFQLPLNPLTFYFQGLGPQYEAFYSQALATDYMTARTELEKQGLVENTLTVTRCLEPEKPYPMSPFNAFYYFKPAFGDCPKDLQVEITVTAVEELPVKTTYPEFHRLFADKQVKMFIFYGEVDHEEMSAKALATRLQEEGYQLETSPDNVMSLKKDISGIQFEVVLAVAKLTPNARELMGEAVKDSEVIVYDGHAGYGAAIDSSFNKPDSYPKNTYQIFLLNGCETYRYGTTQMMYTKSIADFDFHNRNIDVISTYDQVTGHTQQEVMLRKLEEAAPIYVAGSWNEATEKSFEATHSWLAIITDINKESDSGGDTDNGIFMVSGEEGNDYTPGKVDYEEAPPASEAELLALINDDTLDLQYRGHVLNSLVFLKIEPKKTEPLTSQIQIAGDYCRTLKAQGLSSQLLNTVFYSNSCQIQSLMVTNSEQLQGFTLSAGKKVFFYDDGAIKRAKFEGSVTIDGVEYRGPAIAFHDNGLVAAGSVTERTIDGLTFTGAINVFPSGKIRAGSLKEDLLKNNILWMKDMFTEFNEAGNIVRGKLAQETVISNVTFPAGVVVELFDDGALKGVSDYEGKEIVLPSIDLKIKYGSARLHPNGSLAFAYGVEFDGKKPEIAYKGEAIDMIFARSDGSILAYGPKTIPETIPYPCSTESDFVGVLFYPNGQFAACKLATAITIEGVSYNPEDTIALDESGKLLPNDERTLRTVFDKVGYFKFIEEHMNYNDELNSIYNLYWEE